MTSKLIFNEIKKDMNENCMLVPDLVNLQDILDKVLKPGDLLLTMGAGDIWRYNESYVENMEKQAYEVSA